MAEVIEFDTSKALEGIRGMNRELDAFNQTAEQTKKATRDIFPDVEEATQVAEVVRDLTKNYKDLQGVATTLRGALDRATDPEAVKIYAQALAKAEKGLEAIQDAAKRGGVELEAAGKKGAKAVDEIAKSASTAKQVTAELFGAFTKVSIIVEAIQLVKDFTVESVSLAREIRKTERQFSALTGGADNAKKVLYAVNQAAANLNLPEKEAQDSAKSLLSFGVAADQIPAALQRIADTARGTGNEVSKVSEVYAEIKSAGKLTTDSITSLGVTAGPILKQLAQQFGTNEEGVRRLAAEGQIAFADFEQALFDLTKQGGAFYQASLLNADGFDKLSGSLTKFKGYVGEFFKPAADELVRKLNQIVEAANGVAEAKGFGGTIKALEEFSATLLYNAIPGLETVRNKIKGLFSSDTPAIEQTAVLTQVATSVVDSGAIDEAAALEQKRLDQINAFEKRRAAAADAAAKKAAADSKKRAAEIARLRVEALMEGEAKEIAQENLRFDSLARELRKYHLSTEQAEQQHADNVAKIRLKYYLEQLTKDSEAQQAELESRQRGFEELEALENADAAARTARLQQNQQVQQDAANLEAANFEAGLLKARDIFSRKKRSDAEIAEYEKEVAKVREVFQLQQQAAELQRKLDFNKTLSAADKALIQQQIDNLQEQARQVAAGVGDQKPKQPFSFAKLLGLDPENPDDQKLIAGVQRLGQELSKAFTASADARLEAAQKAKQAAEESVNSAQSALDEQIKLAELGFASDVDLAKRRLDAAKEQQQKALAEEEAAAARKRKIEEVQQVVSLITASANIFQSLSSIPFGVGIPLAIGIIATMLGSYVSAKARIKNTVKAREGMTGRVGPDGVVVGNRHESGGVQLNVEDGEFFGTDGKRFGVVRREMTRKHFDLLQAVNANDRQGMVDALRGLTGYRPAYMLRRDLADSLPIPAQYQSRNSSTTDAGYWAENNSLLRQILRAQQQQEQVTDLGDYVLVKKGGVTTRRRKAKG